MLSAKYFSNVKFFSKVRPISHCSELFDVTMVTNDAFNRLAFSRNEKQAELVSIASNNSSFNRSNAILKKAQVHYALKMSSTRVQLKNAVFFVQCNEKSNICQD